jgi:Amt family ammonium transporter
MPAHDLTWGAIGGVILWFGWYGFNPGSTLSAMDWQGIGRVSANTTIAACAGGMMAVLWVYPQTKKWDLGISVNGFLGGLVAITCPCYWVSPWGAVCIGAIAGIVVPLGINLLEHLRIDDPIGAVPVHAFAGIWGTLSLGLFACGKYGVPTADGFDNSTVVKGLFYGGGVDQLKAQFIGSAACVILVTGTALIIMFAIKQIRGSWGLRLDKDGELEGLDIVEHGTPAYHVEFGYGMSYTTPTGAGLPGVSSIDLKAESENQPV